MQGPAFSWLASFGSKHFFMFLFFFASEWGKKGKHAKNIKSKVQPAVANDRNMLNAPVLVQSLKLSNIEPS